MVAEIYPSLWRKDFPRQGRTADQHDAFVAAEWMRRADRTGELAGFLQLPEDPAERLLAGAEGWILGVR